MRPYIDCKEVSEVCFFEGCTDLKLYPKILLRRQKTPNSEYASLLSVMWMLKFPAWRIQCALGICWESIPGPPVHGGPGLLQVSRVCAGPMIYSTDLPASSQLQYYQNLSFPVYGYDFLSHLGGCSEEQKIPWPTPGAFLRLRAFPGHGWE